MGMLGLLTGWPDGWGLGIIWTDGLLLGTTWFPWGGKLDPIKSARVENIWYKNNFYNIITIHYPSSLVVDFVMKLPKHY